MIALNTATRSLQVVLAGAKNTNDCPLVASYSDVPASPQIGPSVDGSTPGSTNGVTAVTIMAAPAISPQYTRRLRSFNLNNADLAAVTVSILYNDNGTTYALFKTTLQTLEQLVYEEGFGFRVYDVNGAEKTQAAATSSATSTAQLLATSAWSVLTQINAPNSVLSTSVQASSMAVTFANLSASSFNAAFWATASSQASSAATTFTNLSASSFNAAFWATASSEASSAATTFANLSASSFNAAFWNTVSSAASRVKSSFSW